MFQVSLHESLSGDVHVKLGQALSGLREDVLIMCSGHCSHNMREKSDPTLGDDVPRDKVVPWTREFGDWVRDTVLKHTGEQRMDLMRHFETKCPQIRRAHPRYVVDRVWEAC